MFLLIVLALAALLYYFYIKPQWYLKSRNVPFDRPLPLFGHMGKTVLKINHMMIIVDKMYYKYSNSRYFGFFNFQQPILVIRDPELIKQVTVKDFDSFPCHRAMVNEETDPLWSKNLFSIQNVDKWRKMRATLSPTFTANKMRVMFELMQVCAKNVSNHYLQQKEEIIELDIKDALRRYATDVIASTAFGISVDSLKDRENDFYKMGKEISNFNGIRAIKFFLLGSSPLLAKILKMRIFGKKETDFFEKIVKENIRTREEKGIVRPDMIHLLLEARKGKPKMDKNEEEKEETNSFAAVDESETTISKDARWLKQISDEDITAQAIIFFLAGYETASTMISFAIAELAVNPEIQEKLFKEVQDVYERTGMSPKYDDVQRMKYLDNVVSETLRKWALGILDRQVEKPYIIPRENGFPPLKLNKGDSIWIPVFSIQRDPQYYPNPEKFDPDRFSDERKHEIKSFTYLPFGSGPRNCIGSRFALMEAKIIIFYLLLNFIFVPTSKSKLPLKLDESQFMLQIEGGFIFGLKKRPIPEMNGRLK